MIIMINGMIIMLCGIGMIILLRGMIIMLSGIRRTLFFGEAG